ncbi:MAG: LysE family transporter [Pseudomonadota bacterium]
MTEAALVLLPLVLAHFAAAASPGPSFVLIARTSVARTRAAGIRMSVGLGLGALFWAAAALFGLSVLFETVPWTYAVLKVAGAVFLVFIGWTLWRNARAPIMLETPGVQSQPGWRDLCQGFLVQIANPKVSIFFGSVFVTLIPPDAPLSLLLCLLALIFMVETLWYILVSTLFSVPQICRRYTRAKSWIDRATGGFLGLLGMRLAAS